MKYLSLFSGIGAFEKALDNLNVAYDLVGYCEIEKNASKAYSAIHDVPETMNFGDITQIDEKALPKDINLITYGFPCQDISLAGTKKGLFNEDGSPTRSGLFFDALRIIEETKPNIAIAENVKNLTSKSFAKQFGIVLDSLEQAGYNNYWKVLSANEYGIPQKRERVYLISIRKDIDNGMFTFPKGFDNGMRLKDIVEENVDAQYYLTDKQIESIYNWKAFQRPFKRICGKESICPTITARGAGEYHSGMVLYSATLLNDTNCEKNRTKEQTIEYVKTLAPRVLTEREAFRVIGFPDESYEKAVAVGIKKRELYRQAGNSIAIPVVEHITKALLDSGVLSEKSEDSHKAKEDKSKFKFILNHLGGFLPNKKDQ